MVIGSNFWNKGRTQEIKERVLHIDNKDDVDDDCDCDDCKHQHEEENKEENVENKVQKNELVLTR